ncbi:MAG TPA: bifunctional YncE family protein/alkaline phosphatase family protein [Gemmatimonadaceae bacterium]|jgi:sugar lactone lactonase YvrE
MRHLLCAILIVTTSCHLAGRDAPPDAQDPRVPHDRLPTGVRLDPAGTVHDVGPLPLSMIESPDGKYFVLVLSGYTDQGAQVIERASGRVVQTLVQPAAFVGGAFSRDGRELFVSGGNRDLVYRYSWNDGHAELRDSLVLAVVAPKQDGKRYPAGIAASADGHLLFVAENLADSLAVVNLASGQVVQRFATERYPYDVVVARDGRVFVSAWGGGTVSVFAPDATGLRSDGRVPAGRHPSALLLSEDGSRLFAASGSTDRVTVVDTRRRRIVGELLDPPPGGPGEGSTPNALALSANGTRLYVAEGDANAIAVFDLSPATSNVGAATGDDRLAGRIPTGWYPTALRARGDTLWAVNGKGRGTAPNPKYPQPLEIAPPGLRGQQYTLGQLHGTISTSLTARATGSELQKLTARVSRANGWDGGRSATAVRYPPFKHVMYIMKENRTYDQVFGDIRAGDGDPSLLFFPREISPNHHALADRFGLFDRFFVNAEVSADGHNWSMAAYASDYVEKTVQSNYSDRGRDYDYGGTNRGVVPDDDVNEPASGYLWNLAEGKGITFRNYGEFTEDESKDSSDVVPAGWRATKPFLYTRTNPRYPGWSLSIRDQRRADVWIEELQEFSRKGEMPALEILYLPNDHTWGATARHPTPRAYMADNDLALGRVIEALSQSPFWKNTVVFVLEDDAQSGPDHVDSHRTPMLVISPYNRSGTIHRFANTTDVLRTIEEILGLGSLSHFDYYGRPLREIWSSQPDLRPYRALTPSTSLDELNVASTRESKESELLDFGKEDAADEDRFNRILWRTIKGPNVPYPGSRRVSALELKR